MAFFPAEFSRGVAKHINKLEGVMKKRILEKIEKLEKNPFPQEVERVDDFEGEKVFRVRAGDQRILYIVRHNPNKLIVFKVDKRSRVYD